MTVIKKVSLMALLCGLAFAGQAGTPEQEAYESYAYNLSSSFKTLSVFFSNSFKKSAGFTSGAHGFAPPAARKKFGFNAGLMGGITVARLDKSSAKAGLADEGMVNFVESMPEVIPMGQGGVNLHFGLPGFYVFESFFAH